MNKFQIFERLMVETDDKLKKLRQLGIDNDPAFAPKWITMEKTMKVVEHKVSALKEHSAKAKLGAMPLDRPMIERGLDRAIKAAELLSLQLDDLIEDTKS